MSNDRGVFWGAFVSVACFAFAACGEGASPVDAEALTIYSSLPLQGDSQPQSEDIVRAIELALEEHGGQAGDVPIKYVSLDDASAGSGHWEPDLVAANAQRAAADQTAIAYIGEFNSGASTTSIPILNEAGILQVSPSNTYVGLTRADGAEAGEPDIYYPTRRRTFGRVVPADHIQAAALVAYMADKDCTALFVTNDAEVYGKGLADQVEAVAAGQDLAILENETLTPETFEATLTRVAETGADCYFHGGITQNGASEAFDKVGTAIPDITLFGGDGLAESAFTQNISPGVQPRIFLTNPTLRAEAYPEPAQTFFSNFTTAYGHTPEPYAIYGYEALSVVLAAIEAAGDEARPGAKGRAAVVARFFEIEDRESVLGTYSIDDNGDTTLATYGGYAVKDDELEFDATITATGVLPAGPAQPIASPTPVEVATPFPEGVYETTPSAQAWIAAGEPQEAGIRHRITFKEGRLHGQCILKDGSIEECLVGNYRDVGDHEVEFFDDHGSFRLHWRFEGDLLIFEMDPDQGDQDDRIVFTSSPWTPVE